MFLLIYFRNCVHVSIYSPIAFHKCIYCKLIFPVNAHLLASLRYPRSSARCRMNGDVFDLSYAVRFRIICSRLMTSVTAERELVIKHVSITPCLQRNDCVHFNSLSVTASHGPYSSNTEDSDVKYSARV